MPLVQVPGFLPSRSGFHFANSWPPDTIYPVVTLPIIGTVAAQDATRGLCGGFVFAALDLFLHEPRLSPPADTRPAADGTPLFNYIASRQVDSIALNGIKYIQWIQTPDQDDGLQLFDNRGLARRMVETEWPAIKADIDSGVPSPLALIAPPQAGLPNTSGIIEACSNSHQVLAWAYDLDESSNITLFVYDSNQPNNDGTKISIGITGDPIKQATISAPSITAILRNDIRALFRSTYIQRNPAF
jgi:hypothetical protein